MRERDRHETVTAPALDIHRAGARDGIIRARERDLVDDDKAAGIPRDVDALPQGHRADQARVTFLAEPQDQLCQGLFTLQVDGQVRTLAQGLRSRHRPAS